MFSSDAIYPLYLSLNLSLALLLFLLSGVIFGITFLPFNSTLFMIYAGPVILFDWC